MSDGVLGELRGNRVSVKGGGWVDGWMGGWVDGMLSIRRSLGDDGRERFWTLDFVGR